MAAFQNWIVVAGARQPREASQSRPVSLTIAAIARARSSPSASRPATTPARSAALRFWLVFHLPRMSATSISIPMIALR